MSRAEIELPADTDPYADAVYATAVRNFERLRPTGAARPGGRRRACTSTGCGWASTSRPGVAGCFSVDEYERDVIKKHERTRKDKEDDRTRHMLELRAQTGPVFLTYPRLGAVDAVAARVTRGAPLFDFTAADGVQHTRVARRRRRRRGARRGVRARFPSLYIADGHHRAASACARAQALRERAGGAGAARGRHVPRRRVSRATRCRSCPTTGS